MFSQVGWGEIGVILLLALFVVGPDRLPGLAADAGKGLRQLRIWLKGMTDDLKTELGPELGDVDLASLHPKTFVKKHLLDDWDKDDFDLGVDLRAEKDDWLSKEPRARGTVPLGAGESPPWDPDTT